MNLLKILYNMKELNPVFFAKEGEKSLTETSAAHLCALANQIKASDESMLNNISFVNTEMNIVGAAGSSMLTEVGISEDDLIKVSEALERVSDMNAFIAWFAEARKNLEDYKEHRMDMDINEWAEEKGIDLPTHPTNRSSNVRLSTLQDVINNMNIKDRLTYLSLEAKAAVFGKFIHPDRPMELARKAMHEVYNKPYATVGQGRDTLIYHYIASINPKKVDEQFNQLQRDYRSVEQSLNHIKSDLRKKLQELNIKENNEKRNLNREYEVAVDEYNKIVNEYCLQYNEWKQEEQARLSKIKFAIPNALAKTVEYLNKG
jgi:hypothetical protein